MLLLKSDGLTVEEADAIDTVMGVIHDSLDPSRVTLPSERRVTAEETSVAEYLATVPVFLEHFTFEGDEIEGAKPLQRL